MRRPLWIPWRWWRRAAQLALLAAFLWLFRRTDSGGADQLPGGENFFFRLDPLLGSAAMLAGRQFLAAFWPAAIVVALTLVFGRFFCGWVCPLGTMLDGFHFLLRPITRRTNAIVGGDSRRRLQAEDRRQESPPTAESQNSRGPTARGRAIRYVLLIAVLLAAVFAFPLVGFVDPFSLLFRGLAFWGDPMLHRGVEASFGWLGDGWAADVLHPFARKHLLPFQRNDVSSGRGVGRDPGNDFRAGIRGSAILVPVSLPGGSDVRLAGSLVVVETVAGRGLQVVRQLCHRMPHGGARCGRRLFRRSVQSLHGLRRSLSERHRRLPVQLEAPEVKGDGGGRRKNVTCSSNLCPTTSSVPFCRSEACSAAGRSLAAQSVGGNCSGGGHPGRRDGGSAGSPVMRSIPTCFVRRERPTKRRFSACASAAASA